MSKAPASCSVSAPGKLMLMGEHAVLHGRCALVAAVDRRLHARLRPRDDDRVTIASGVGEWSGRLAELEPSPPLAFVRAAIVEYRDGLPGGLDLELTADFDPRLGLGSSAAATAATVATLQLWRDGEVQPGTVFSDGLRAIHAVQGTGSGADLAASVFGGVILYRRQPTLCEIIPHLPPITVVYTGRKVRTPDVIRQVQELHDRLPGPVEGVYDAMDAAVLAAVHALEAADWPRLGKLFTLNAALMQALGVCPPDLQRLLTELDALPGLHGAKLSGAGLGDCIVAVGTPECDTPLPAEAVPLAIEPTGLRIES